MTQQANRPCPYCSEPLTEGTWEHVAKVGRVSYSICFGDHRVYRYWLEAKVPLAPEQKDKGTCLFLMLNPSDTDEEEPDPTVRTCLKFAKQWGYGISAVMQPVCVPLTHTGGLTQCRIPDWPWQRTTQHRSSPQSKQGDSCLGRRRSTRTRI